MVLNGQLEISKSYAHRRSDTKGDDKSKAKDAIESIWLTAPECGKDVVQLNRDGTEGQKAAHDAMDRPGSVPRSRWDLSWDILGSAGSIKIRCVVFPNDATKYSKRVT